MKVDFAVRGFCFGSIFSNRARALLIVASMAFSLSLITYFDRFT